MPRTASPARTDRPVASGFRLGVYAFDGAEVLDFSLPFGVFAVARRFDPELQVIVLAESLRAVTLQSGLTVMPSCAFADQPALDALLVPGGPGMRHEMHNGNLHRFVRGLPDQCLLASVGSGAWLFGRMGLLDGLSATSRKEPDRLEATHLGKAPIDRLAELAPDCRISLARLVDAGRLVTASGMAAGLELGLHLLQRAGLGAASVDEVARVMEHRRAHELHRHDIELAAPCAHHPPPHGPPQALAATKVRPPRRRSVLSA